MVSVVTSVVASVGPDAAEAQRSGVLSQLASPEGCVSEADANGDCIEGKALDGARSIAVSPDGHHVYVASFLSDAVAVFKRDRIPGILTQLAGTDGCVSATGTGGICAEGVALDGPISIAVSPDGVNVYVASHGSGAVVVFARNRKTGALTQLDGTAGCVSDSGTAGGCTDGVALAGALAVTVSADGRNVYVTSDGSNAVAVFARHKKTGALTQLAGTAACVSDGAGGLGGACAAGRGLAEARSVAVSADGRHVYVASIGDSAVAVFARNRQTGALTQLAGSHGCVSDAGGEPSCAHGVGLHHAISVTVSRDGRHVYVGSTTNNAIAVFRREKSGALTQLAGLSGCISEHGAIEGPCTDGVALNGAFSVGISSDGRHVYVAAVAIGAVSVFARDKKTGVLTQLPGTHACASETGFGGACDDAVGLDGAASVGMTRDGRHVYVASFHGGAVAYFFRD
jgi:6-phosphogluconolactonase (cycloisomerase 2 family)